MKKGMGWVWLVVVPLSLATCAAFAGAFDPPDGVTSALTWNGFSNGFVSTSISTDSGGSFISIAAGQFQGYFDGDRGDTASVPPVSPDDFFRFFCIEVNQFADTEPVHPAGGARVGVG